VPLVDAIEHLFWEARQRWSDYDELGVNKQSYALMEEYLFWVAVLHR
jgi:hypothetical protein